MTTPSRSTRAGLIEDTRQQEGRHTVKHDWWAAHGVPVERRKLDHGDYADASGFSNIIVDTKRNVQELAQNCGREHARFVREIERANNAGDRLVFLIEEHPEYNDRGKLDAWVSGVCRRCRKCDPLRDKCRVKRFKPMGGRTLRKIMDRLETDHGARFVFCRKADAARAICDLLGVEYDR